MKLDLKEIYDDYLIELDSINKSDYQAKNPNKYYRASSAGHCFKKHWYAINGYQDGEMSDKSKRLLRLGTIVHRDIEKAINWHEDRLACDIDNEYNVSFKTEYEVLIKDLNVMGSADIVLIDSEKTASVLDVKTTHSWKWKMMFGRNKEIKPSRMYELQLGTYGMGVALQEDISHEDMSLFLVYYKKDDSSMRYVDVNPVWMDNAFEYWANLNETLDLIKDESDLPRDTLNVPVEHWECKYCPYESICN